MSPSYSNSLPTLIQARTNLVNLIQLVTAQAKPDYSVNGQSVQWGNYLKILMEQLPLINQQIQVAGGPIELQTQAIGTGSTANGYWTGPI